MILARIYENIHGGNPELDNILTFLFRYSKFTTAANWDSQIHILCDLFFCCLNLKLIGLATGSNIGRDNSIRYQDQPQPRSGGSAQSSILQRPAGSRPACVHCSM